MAGPERAFPDASTRGADLMAIPDFQTLMLPVLKSAAGGGEVRIGDVVNQLANVVASTDEERCHFLPSGRQTTFAAIPFSRHRW